MLLHQASSCMRLIMVVRDVVDLVRKAYSYKIWNLTRLPCKHGIFAIVKNLEKVEDYVHPCYLKETFFETYKEIIQLMPGQSEWVETNLLLLLLMCINHLADHQSKEKQILKSQGTLIEFLG